AQPTCFSDQWLGGNHPVGGLFLSDTRLVPRIWEAGFAIHSQDPIDFRYSLAVLESSTSGGSGNPCDRSHLLHHPHVRDRLLASCIVGSIDLRHFQFGGAEELDGGHSDL